MSSIELIKELKEASNWKMTADKCINCRYFIPTDCSGNHNAKESHCIVHLVTEIPTDTTSACKFFDQQDPAHI